MIRSLEIGLVGLLLVMGAGCATTQDLAATDPMAASNDLLGAGAGDVVFVRTDERYLIVRGGRLPNPGEQAKVFRDETPVGTVRFTGLVQGDFSAADILEGILLPGDRVVR
jgi:hypothetical protein